MIGLPHVPEPVVAFGVALKVTAVLAIARGVTGLAARATAATRHRIWRAAIAASLALIAVTPWAPALAVRVPVEIGDRGLTLDALARGIRLLSTLWAIGALVAGAWYVSGHLAAARLAFRARRTPVRLAEDAISLALRRRHVRVLWSEDVSAPLTLGMFSPRVLLPRSARAWRGDRLRAVLLHELAHVERGDLWFQALGAALRSWLWFDPLCWYALDRLRIEGELACDERVLRSGVPAADYAAHLLAVARAMPRPARLAAAGMATGAGLEQRVRAILDPVNALALARPLKCVLILAALVLVPLACVRTRLELRPAGSPTMSAARR